MYVKVIVYSIGVKVALIVLFTIQGDRGRVVCPAQIATPPSEGVPQVDCRFHGHHIPVDVGASRGGSDRTACRLLDRQRDRVPSKRRTDRRIADKGDRGRVGHTAQIARPSGEGVAYVRQRLHASASASISSAMMTRSRLPVWTSFSRMGTMSWAAEIFLS